VEIEGVSGPGGEADNEEEPAAAGQLGEQANGVAQRHRACPLGARLAELVRHDDALLEVEQVMPGLPGRCQHALGDGVGRFVCRFHGPDSVGRRLPVVKLSREEA
jgi:hypothetical protein